MPCDGDQRMPAVEAGALQRSCQQRTGSEAIGIEVAEDDDALAGCTRIEELCYCATSSERIVI